MKIRAASNRASFIALAVLMSTASGQTSLPSARPLNNPSIQATFVVRRLGTGITNGIVRDMNRSRLAFTIREDVLGGDRNGDGDQSDVIPFIYTNVTGKRQALDTTVLEGPLTFGGPLMTFMVSESADNTDLNGDGLLDAFIGHVHDARDDSIANIGMSAWVGSADSAFAITDETVAFAVKETFEGADLDGDGFVYQHDNVLHLYDLATDTLTNTGLVTWKYFFGGEIDDPKAARDGLVAFLAREDGTDLNGDGDVTGFEGVPHLYDALDGSMTNLGVAGLLGHLERDLVLVEVSEQEQGNSDLSGDGDADDWVLHRYDVGAAQLTNLGFAVVPPTTFCDPKGKLPCDLLLACTATSAAGYAWMFEADNGGDRNADGDQDDQFLVEIDRATGQTTEIGIALSSTPIAWGSSVRFFVSEAGQGGTDLNGDGDLNDSVLHLRELGVTHNLGLARGGESDHQSRTVATAVSESGQGNQDLNGDGDALDNVMFVRTGSMASPRNLGLAVANPVRVAGDLVTFAVRESSQAAGGVDLNGDGDTLDNVVHIFDARDGQVHNLGLAIGGDAKVAQNAVTFQVWEASQGADLNGDGDQLDSALFFVSLR